MKQWGWLAGVVIMVAVTPMLWANPAQPSPVATASGQPANYVHPRHLSMVPRPAPSMIASGRMAFAVGAPDWNAEFGINHFHLGMSMAEVEKEMGGNRPTRKKRGNLTVDTYQDWMTVVYDANQRVVKLEGRSLDQTDRVVASTETILRHHVDYLGKPDDVMDTPLGAVSVWYQDPVIIQYIQNRQRYVLTAQGQEVP